MPTLEAEFPDLQCAKERVFQAPPSIYKYFRLTSDNDGGKYGGVEIQPIGIDEWGDVADGETPASDDDALIEINDVSGLAEGTRVQAWRRRLSPFVVIGSVQNGTG